MRSLLTALLLLSLTMVAPATVEARTHTYQRVRQTRRHIRGRRSSTFRQRRRMRRARRSHRLTRSLRGLLPRTRIRARYRVIVRKVKRAARNARRRGRHLISTLRMRRLGSLLGRGRSSGRASSGVTRGLFGFSVAGGERVERGGRVDGVGASTRGRDSVDGRSRRYETGARSRSRSREQGSGPAQVLQPSDLKGLVAPALLAN